MSALAKLIDRSRREREDWRYTDLDKLLKQPPANTAQTGDLPLFVREQDEQQCLTFVDGVFQSEQSRLGALPASILEGDAATGYRLSFAARNCMVTAPVELKFLGNAAETETRLTVEVGASTSLTLIEHHDAATGAHLVETDIRLGPQAKLIHKTILHHADAAFSKTRAHVAEGAYYRHFLLVQNARLARHESEIELVGPLAQCDLSGALLLRGREHADVVTRVRHTAPHGESRQLFKAIVKDQARGVFQGRIEVAPGAQKTDARQLCRALLLSDQAEMDAKPELEIYADDVACAHGCAIGDLDADAMFYLRARGLDVDAARSLLLRAFVEEVIEANQTEYSRGYFRALTERWMNEQA